MANGSCPVCKCKSWEENKPINWIIVATVSGVVTAILTAVLAKWWGITALQAQQRKMALQNPTIVGKYRVG